MDGEVMRIVVLGMLFFVLIGTGCIVAPEIPGLPDAVASGACYKPCHIYLNPDEPPGCYEASLPGTCTLEYRLGDACLKYLSCKNVGGQCEAELDPRFHTCISCYRLCTEMMNGSVDTFRNCELLCAPKI
jgi:hypothetical protein